MRNLAKESKIRNLVFGIQDSFGSTVGFLSGVAVSSSTRHTLLFTGILLIFVEAFSMALGNLISDHTVEEVNRKQNLPIFSSLSGPIIMFFAYAISGFVPLAPYVFFFGDYSLVISIIISILFLVIVGYISAIMYKIQPLHHTMEILMIGILSIGVGVVIGKLFSGV